MTDFLFGSSRPMKDLEQKVRSVASSGLPLLIEGERGTGKEALAEHIHRLSRRKGALIRIECSGDGADSLAAQLLTVPGDGVGEGASAMAGTVLLKQVGLLPDGLQRRLLAAFESGSAASLPRLVCTSVEPLEHVVARGEFLPELYFRLAVCRLYLPALRERARDTIELFGSLVARVSGNGRSAARLSPRLVQALGTYSWPGNLRELQDFAHSYAIFPDPEQIITEIQRRCRILDLQRDGIPDAANGSGESLREQVRKATRQLESEIILSALERHHWNRRRAAETLKISYRTLLYKMKNCDLRAAEEAEC